MSERNDTDDKITVLFPDRDSDSGEGGSDEADDEVRDDVGADESVGDEEPSGGGDADADADADADTDTESDSDDNVVRLDFDSDSAGAESSGDKASEESPAIGDGRMTSKYEVFNDMIADGMVMVTLDTRADGVEVPPKFQGLPELRLNFSHMFHINDFDYDADGVRASLSFDGTRHFCDVPWEAVFMLYSHESGDVIVFDPVSPPGSE